jgi:hypothetical protein
VTTPVTRSAVVEVAPALPPRPAPAPAPQPADTAPPAMPPFVGRLLIATAAILWLVALAGTDVADIGRYGLLDAFPWPMYVAFATLTAGFVLSLRHRASGAQLATCVVLLVLMLHATAAIVEETIRYSWSWKHLGLVDFYSREMRPDPQILEQRVYHNWPGFFAAVAPVVRALGLDDARPLAQWAPPAFQLLNVVALHALFGRLTKDRRVLWLAIWLFLCANWIGQEYFSPQAFAFFLYLSTIAVVLRAFGRAPAMPQWARRWAKRAPIEPDAAPRFSRRQLVGYGVVFGICVVALATSHPLTPITLCIALALLATAGVVRRFTPALVAGTTLLWMFTGARTFIADETSSLYSEFGTLRSNVDSNLHDGRLTAEQQQIVLIGRLVVVVVAFLALVGFVRAWRAGQWHLAALLLSVAPAGILVGGGYGGEAVFRTFLFSLPFLAFLAAAGLYAASWRPPLRTAAAFFVACALLGGTLFAYFGKEQWYHFSKSEVRAAELLYTTGKRGAVIVEGTPNYPNRFENYERFTYVPISREPRESYQRVLRDPVDKLLDWLSDPRYTAGYLIITKSQKAEVDNLGGLPAGALERVERAVLRSGRFKVLYHDDDATVVTVQRKAAGARS